MDKTFAKFVYASDGEQVVVYKQERADATGSWTCGVLTRYGDLNEGHESHSFATYDECHAFFCGFDVVAADAALDVAQGIYYEDARSKREATRTRIEKR